MKIHILHQKASKQEMREMLEAHDGYIKVAVDVGRGILAGGGAMHADCKMVLLKIGSRKEDVWGASWAPDTGGILFESLINRREDNRRKTQIEDSRICAQVQAVVEKFLKGGSSS